MIGLGGLRLMLLECGRLIDVKEARTRWTFLVP